MSRTRTAPLPPFQSRVFFCLAYVKGRYGLPSYRKHPHGYFGLYFTRVRGWPRFCFLTFTLAGKYQAYSAIDSVSGSVEFALLRAMVSEAVSPEQWRLYPVCEAETRILQSAKSLQQYEKVRAALAHALWIARIPQRHHRIDPAKARLFEIKPRTARAIRLDKRENAKISELVLGAIRKKKGGARSRPNKRSCPL